MSSAFRTADIPDLGGQVIIVTGGNVGLGLETVKQLNQHNPARIYLAARSQPKAEAAIEQLRKEGQDVSRIHFLKLDLASLSSVRTAAQEILSKEDRLDILINNAGIMMVAPGLTADGFEIQFGTNVLGPALFTRLLLPLLRNTAKSRPSRAIILASSAHSRAPTNVYDFGALRTTAADQHTTVRYTTSKLANIHYAKQLAEEETSVVIIPVHPGMVATNLHHASSGTFLKPFLNIAVNLFATPVEKGALSQIWTAVSPDAKSGQYYGPVGKAESGSRLVQDKELQLKLFDWVEEQIQPYM